MFENTAVEILVAVIVTIITLICVLFHRIKNGNYGRSTNQPGGATASTGSGRGGTDIPEVLVRHARSCGRTVHDIACDEESMFASLADQLRIRNPDSVFTAQSLQQSAANDPRLRRISAGAPRDDHCWLQVVANILRRRIFVYRDDPNPPYCIQPDISFAGQSMEELYIGCIDNVHYVSLRPQLRDEADPDSGVFEELGEPTQELVDVSCEHLESSEQSTQYDARLDVSPDLAYNDENVEYSVDGASAAALNESDTEDGRSNDDTETEDFEMVQIGNNNTATINLTHNEGCTVHRSVQVLNYGDDNSVRLVINIPQPVLDYGNQMINRGAEVTDEHIGMKIEISATSQGDIDRAETEILHFGHGIQQDINTFIRHRGVELVYLGSGCILLNFKPDSWKSAMQFVTDVYYKEYMEMFAVLFSLPIFPTYFPLFEKVSVTAYINKPVTTAPEASKEQMASVSTDKERFNKDGSRYMMKRFYRENGSSSRRLMRLSPFRIIEDASEEPRPKFKVEARFKPILGATFGDQVTSDFLLEDIATTVARDIVSRTYMKASGVNVSYLESADSESVSD